MTVILIAIGAIVVTLVAIRLWVRLRLRRIEEQDRREMEAQVTARHQERE